MTYQQIERFVNNFAYFAVATWITLTLIMVVSLLTSKSHIFRRFFKFTINSGVFAIALLFYGGLSIIVSTAILETKTKSVNYLKTWIGEYQLRYALIAILVLIALYIFNFLWNKKMESKINNRDAFALLIIDSLVLGFGIWLAGKYTYISLLQGIERQFPN